VEVGAAVVELPQALVLLFLTVDRVVAAEGVTVGTWVVVCWGRVDVEASSVVDVSVVLVSAALVVEVGVGVLTQAGRADSSVDVVKRTTSALRRRVRPEMGLPPALFQ
jgi:hypothetical protein